jgi:hypothetical protein
MLAQSDDRIIGSLDKIAVPTLVLVGADDTNFYRGGRLHGAEDSGGHTGDDRRCGASNLHQPAAFNLAVADFLAGLPVTA